MSQVIIISIISIISIGIIVGIFLYRNKTSSTSPTPTTPIPTTPIPTTPIPTTPIPTTPIPTTPIPTTPIPTIPPIPAKSMPITFPPIPDITDITPIKPGIPNMNCTTCMKNRTSTDGNINDYIKELHELVGKGNSLTGGDKIMKDEYLQYYSKYFDEFVKQGQSPDKIREHMISYIEQIYIGPNDNFRNKIDKLLNDISNSRELNVKNGQLLNESPITKQLCKNYC